MQTHSGAFKVVPWESHLFISLLKLFLESLLLGFTFRVEHFIICVAGTGASTMPRALPSTSPRASGQVLGQTALLQGEEKHAWASECPFFSDRVPTRAVSDSLIFSTGRSTQIE